MKRSIAVVALLTLSSLAQAGQTVLLKDLVAVNAKRIQQLKPGMTRADVVRVMTDDVAQIPGGSVGNPYKSKALKQGNANYEVLYYVTTEPTHSSDAMTTPVILKEGVVSGLGADALRSLKQ